MKYLLGLLAVIWFFQVPAFGQSTFTIYGKVKDENGNPFPGAVVLLNSQDKVSVTDTEGDFALSGLNAGEYDLLVSVLGYEEFHHQIYLLEDVELDLQLTPKIMTLSEIVVSSNNGEHRKKEEPLSIEIVDSDFLKRNQGGSLMQSLDRLGGVTTIDIGSGQSKPVIRGLGFNRVVVVENGIKHEGQQWGVDHGLEIDQYAVDNVEVIKGPSSLRYGSDAIGGVINIKQNQLPDPNTISGRVELTGKTNNNLLGTSIALEGRGDRVFATFRTTLLDYGDYKVPTDSVDIYSYRAPLYKRQLRNTAGNERNFHFSLGYVKSSFQNRLFASYVRTKSGFFANAYGLEPRNVDTELHDRSNRDTQYPYQKVRHLKVINKTQRDWDNYEVRSELGFQQNFRQELSQYVAHGYMPATYQGEGGFALDLDRQFDKYVYSGNVEGSYFKSGRTAITAGINSTYHNNSIDGHGFIIPAYSQFRLGGFTLFKLESTDQSLLQGGLRYDYGNILIESYRDWFPSPVISGTDTSYQYLYRANDLSRQFSNVSWSIGYNYNTQHWFFKTNIGKSFRIPIAKELGANGVNYHRFSYEVGDPDLNPEESYQLDGSVEYASGKIALGVTPFVNYFSNYIYLNPTAEFDRLYGNGNQVFYYSQTKVFRYGGEVHAHYQLQIPLKLGVVGEYVYQEQLSGDKRGFTLPFSPPASVIFNLKYQKDPWKVLENTYVSVDYKIAGAQKRIVPPEVVTNGYQVVNLSLGGDIRFNEQNLNFSFQVQNLFDNKYFNHTSFYRLINVPEAGRNFILNVSIPLTRQIKNVTNE